MVRPSREWRLTVPRKVPREGESDSRASSFDERRTRRGYAGSDMRQDAGQFDVAVACLTGSVARPRPGGPPGLQSRGSPGGLRCCALQGRFNVPPPSWSHAVVGSASTRGRAALRQGVPMLIVLLLGVAAAPAWGQSGVETTPPAASAQLDNPLGIPDLRNVVPAARDAEGVSASIAILVPIHIQC